jgi:hypothetical protein
VISIASDQSSRKYSIGPKLDKPNWTTNIVLSLTFYIVNQVIHGMKEVGKNEMT